MSRKNKNNAKGYTISDFYCTKCGNKSIPIPRGLGREREPGHLKNIFCVYCKKDTNHVECRGFGQYTKEDFLNEFYNGNFDEKGSRINSVY